MTEETEKRGPGRPRKTEQVEYIACEVVRDYWDANGDRVTEKTVIQVPPIEAIEGIESGILRRVK